MLRSMRTSYRVDILSLSTKKRFDCRKQDKKGCLLAIVRKQ